MSENRYQKGLDIMLRHMGSEVTDHIKDLAEIAPKFSKVNVEYAFGELYAGDVVDDKTRELCTVAALTVQGFSLPQLKVHIEAALRCGATEEEIVEIITQMLAYCGFPAATNAILTAKEVFKNDTKGE